MSLSNLRKSVAYGLSGPLPGIPSFPLVSKRAPTVNDKAPFGQLWVDQTTDTIYFLTSTRNNQANWINPSAEGGTGIFASVTATTGNITATLGSIQANNGISTTTGGITASAGNITAVNGNIVATAGSLNASGNIVSSSGDIVATNGFVDAGTVLRASGDQAGLAGTVQFSSVTDTTIGAGALTITSAGVGSYSNTGLLKIYIGTTAAYIPYFVTIGP